MSERLYYFDAYTTQFSANIIERVQHNGRYAVVLDKTFFYPASGGQPSDLGHINNIPIIDATIREADQAILHWIEKVIETDHVEVEINWKCRFDHMQQHSGQHILSQAFIQVADAETMGFHLSEDSVTIDLDKEELSVHQIEQAELLTNQIVWENRPVKIHMVTTEEALNLPIRKIPPLKNEILRLIEIEGFDLTACGGTHVSHTGEIGIVKLIKLERRKKQLRVEFRCGQRALQDFTNKNIIVNELSGLLTTGHSEIVNAVNRLQEEVKQTHRIIKKQEAELLNVKADQLLQSGNKLGNVTVVSHVLIQSDPAQMKVLAAQLVKHDGVIAFLGLAGSKAQLLFSRSTNAPGEMNQLLKSALQLLEPASGGGNASFAQGGGPPASIDLVTQALARAETVLFEQLSFGGMSDSLNSNKS